MQPGQPEWIELDWPTVVTAGRVELVFDTELQGEYRSRAPVLVRDYTVIGMAPDGTEHVLVDVTDNALRLRCHTFAPQSLQRLRLTVH